MKIEIGGHKHDDWLSLNIDKEWDKGPDIIADAFERLPFADGSLDEISACHIIEHAGWDRIPDILKDWGRTIKSGGYITIKCPDFEYHVKRYTANHHMLYEPGGLMYGLYGQQDLPSMRHRAALDKYWLGIFLSQAGFVDLQWNDSNKWELNVRGKKS